MSGNTDRLNGRRGVLAATATGLLGVIGATLVGVALVGGHGGPPAPSEAASLQRAAPPASAGVSGDVPGKASNHARPHEGRAGGTGRTQGEGAHTATHPRALPRSRPVALHIPAIDVHAEQFVALGRQGNGKIEVPEGNWTVGWYENGPWPGQFGPAVMGGHVDSDAGPAVFYRLGELNPGDIVKVRRADGKIAVFTVYGVEQYPKDQFPTRQVYLPAHNRPELRLITCGGTFNEDAQHYRANIVAYAKMTAVR